MGGQSSRDLASSVPPGTSRWPPIAPGTGSPAQPFPGSLLPAPLASPHPGNLLCLCGCLSFLLPQPHPPGDSPVSSPEPSSPPAFPAHPRGTLTALPERLVGAFLAFLAPTSITGWTWGPVSWVWVWVGGCLSVCLSVYLANRLAHRLTVRCLKRPLPLGLWLRQKPRQCSRPGRWFALEPAQMRTRSLQLFSSGSFSLILVSAPLEEQ